MARVEELEIGIRELLACRRPKGSRGMSRAIWVGRGANTESLLLLLEFTAAQLVSRLHADYKSSRRQGLGNREALRQRGAKASQRQSLIVLLRAYHECSARSSGGSVLQYSPRDWLAGLADRFHTLGTTVLYY